MEVEHGHQQNINHSEFWKYTIFAVMFRLSLLYFLEIMNLSCRPEFSTPLTSTRRVAEGYWLKQSSLSPYAGSIFHSSPLLLSTIGPLTARRIEGKPDHNLCYMLFTFADIASSLLIRSTGQILLKECKKNLSDLGVSSLLDNQSLLHCGDIAGLMYLWSPFNILTSLALSTSSIENLFAILALYGACARLVPVAAFGWVVATHLSLYPAILLIPVILLVGGIIDAPPRKLFLHKEHVNGEVIRPQKSLAALSWRSVAQFLIWLCIWSTYILALCFFSLRKHGGLQGMFLRTHLFILKVEDLSPNIGVFWYFFAEVFQFHRNFFLIVFHSNILYMLLPLAIRLYHRPCFLAFVYITISSVLKSYPSVGDTALYLALFCLFLNELADMKFSLFLFCGYLGISILSPVMHNLWLWRGTGNANFYFASAMAFAFLQIIFVVECVSAVLTYDWKLKNQVLVKKSKML